MLSEEILDTGITKSPSKYVSPGRLKAPSYDRPKTHKTRQPSSDVGAFDHIKFYKVRNRKSSPLSDDEGTLLGDPSPVTFIRSYEVVVNLGTPKKLSKKRAAKPFLVKPLFKSRLVETREIKLEKPKTTPKEQPSRKMSPKKVNTASSRYLQPKAVPVQQQPLPTMRYKKFVSKDFLNLNVNVNVNMMHSSQTEPRL